MSWDVGAWVIATVNSVLGTLIQAHGTQTFTSDGTFTVPAGVTKILVTAFGGGGGGDSYDIGGGQGGDRVIKKAYSVAPGTVIPITIGTGGAEGTDGGATVVGNLVTLAGGGKGGSPKSHRGSPGGPSSTNGMDSPMANGGYGGSSGYYSTTEYRGGGGGGGGYGQGGNGGYGTGSGGYYAGDGANGGIGAGGGAGGRARDGGKYNGDGGNGGNGIVIIEW